MTRIHTIKKAPDAVDHWFRCNFAGPEYMFKYYWYKAGEDKIYGCNVFKNGEFYHNATQAREDWFNKENCEAIPF